MQRADLCIVGGGYVGGSVARLARSRGAEVVVVDAARETSATPCAAGLWRDSWLRGLGDDAERAMRCLAELKIEPERLELAAFNRGFRSLRRRDVFHRIPPEALAWADAEPSLVSSVRADHVVLWDGRVIFADAVLVAAGHWTPMLLPGVRVTPRWGECRRQTIASQDSGAVWYWAPYRQAYRLAEADGRSYFSDGTSVKHWGGSARDKAESRSRVLGFDAAAECRVGARPYRPKGAPLLGRSHGVWFATGTRKNGALLGPALADRLLAELGGE